MLVLVALLLVARPVPVLCVALALFVCVVICAQPLLCAVLVLAALLLVACFVPVLCVALALAVCAHPSFCAGAGASCNVVLLCFESHWRWCQLHIVLLCFESH